jgi:hypothetical protein
MHSLLLQPHSEMMKMIIRITVFIAVFFILSSEASVRAQCAPSTSQWPQSTIFPSGALWQTASTSMYAGDFAKFSVSAGITYQFSLCAEDGGFTGYDSQLTLFEDAFPLVPLAYADQTCGSDARITWQATFTGLLRVQVNQFNCNPNSVFTTLRYRILQSGNPPGNDQCAQAVNLNAGVTCNPINATVSGATASNLLTTCEGQAEDDVWFRFTASNNNDVQLLVNPSGLGFDPVIELFTGSSCNNLLSFFCLDTGVDGESEGVTITDLIAGQTIWIRVFDFYPQPASNPNFSICVFQSQQGVPGDECSVALPINVPASCSSPLSGSFNNFSPSLVPTSKCQLNQRDVWYVFTIASTNFYMDIDPAGMADPAFEYFSGTCGTLVSLGCVNNYPAGVTEQVLFYNGVIGTTIYLRLFDAGAHVATNQNYSVCLYQQLGSTAPINDACSGAGLITAGSTCVGISGTLQNAGPSTPPSLCGGNNTDDVWYRIVATDTAVNIEATPNGLIDGVMEIFTGTCGALSSRFCIDETAAGQPEGVTITGIQPGQIFYVRYYDFSPTIASNPTFSICAWWDAPECTISTPVIVAGGPTSVCTGPVTLSTTSQQGVSYQWYRNGTLINGAGSNTHQASKSGVYTLVASAGPGCSATSNAIAVTIDPVTPVTISASGNTTFCQGGSVELSASQINGATYQWLNNGSAVSSGDNRIYQATSSGLYSVRVTLNGCSATSSTLTVTVNQLPQAEVTPNGPTTFCLGGNVLLQASPGSGYTYQWKRNNQELTGVVNNQILVSETGLYAVMVSDLNGCSSESPGLQINVAGVQAIIALSGPAAICDGNSVQMLANEGFGLSYQWYRDNILIQGASQQNYSAAQVGNYTVSITDPNTCTTNSPVQTITVGQNPAKPMIISSGNLEFCAGDQTELSTPFLQDHQYQWLNEGQSIDQATSRNLQVSTQGNYQVRVQNGSGCQNTSDATEVIVNPPPVVTFNLNPAEVCIQSAPITINGGSPAGGTYTGTGLEAGLFSSSATGSGEWPLVYTFTNTKGCSASDTAMIIVETCAGLAGQQGASIWVYPNPFDDYFKVDVGTGVEDIMLFDMTGRMVWPLSSNQVDGNLVVQTAHLSEGVYHLRVQTGGTLRVLRLIKGAQ